MTNEYLDALGLDRTKRVLDLPDRGFDAVVAHTLLSHVDDPAAVRAPPGVNPFFRSWL